MKRDMDLVRQILIELEKMEFTGSPVVIPFEGYSETDVHYHVKIMGDANLLDVWWSDLEGGHTFYYPISITWAGHEFLAAARDDTRFNRAKDVVLEKTGALSFGVLNALLQKWMMEGVF